MNRDDGVKSGEEADGAGVWRPGQLHQEVDRVDSPLGCGPQCAHDSAPGGCSSPGPVPSPDLPVDDRWPDRLLTPLVGGVDVRAGQEREQCVGFGRQVLHEFAIGLVGMCPLSQQLDPVREVGCHILSFGLRQVPGVEG